MIFVDANVLVALFSVNHAFHSRAVDFMDAVMLQKEYLVISPQVVGEVFVTVTSKRLFKNPATPAHFRKQLGTLQSGGGILTAAPGEKTVEFALIEAEKLGVASARIFDLLLYGTMREHGIKKLATFNVKHFAGLTDIEVVPIP